MIRMPKRPPALAPPNMAHRRHRHLIRPGVGVSQSGEPLNTLDREVKRLSRLNADESHSGTAANLHGPLRACPTPATLLPRTRR